MKTPNMLSEMLALSGVNPRKSKLQERVQQGRQNAGRLKQRRIHEAEDIDPRVQQYVVELDNLAQALGEQIDLLYAQSNAAASIDMATAGEVQAAAGDLRVALGKVYKAIDHAKEKVAAVNPRMVAH